MITEIRQQNVCGLIFSNKTTLRGCISWSIFILQSSQLQTDLIFAQRSLQEVASGIEHGRAHKIFFEYLRLSPLKVRKGWRACIFFFAHNVYFKLYISGWLTLSQTTPCFHRFTCLHNKPFKKSGKRRNCSLPTMYILSCIFQGG